MHSLQIEDVDLFNEDVIVYEVLAVPKLLSQDEEKKKAIFVVKICSVVQYRI